ncbi:4-hydroxy-tetrahydrodipicolinate synthase [bacterium]|nr:4-hydroxy-tetrahydrodipicolinate synthase [bacterium]
MKQLGRVLTAMVTPFDSEGKVDVAMAKRLAKHLIENGSDGLVVVGTTGESPTLTHDEKLEMYRAAVEAVGSSGSVVAGTGSNDTAATIALTQEAEAIGVDGILLIAPYYNKPNQEGLYRHFKAVAESTRLPIILYNHPPRTGVSIAPETLARLAEIPNIVGLKDSSASLDAASDFRKVVPESFLLYSGNDSLTLPYMSIGGYGVISVATHVAGREVHAMVDACVQGQWQTARDLHFKLWDLFNGLFIAPSPAPVKDALKMVGLETGGVRLPLIEVTDAEHARVEEILKGLRLIKEPVEA